MDGYPLRLNPTQSLRAIEQHVSNLLKQLSVVRLGIVLNLCLLIDRLDESKAKSNIFFVLRLNFADNFLKLGLERVRAAPKSLIDLELRKFTQWGFDAAHAFENVFYFVDCDRNVGKLDVSHVLSIQLDEFLAHVGVVSLEHRRVLSLFEFNIPANIGCPFDQPPWSS